MYRSKLLRGVSAGALSLVVSSTIAHSQQSLPTIDVGAARRSMSARPTAAPRSEGQPTGPSTAALAASNFPSEPKTPTEGYVVRNSTTGTKTDVPIKEMPVTVNVVPRQVMIDQNTTVLREALENVPGVRSNNTDGDTSGSFVIRGFQTSYLFRNNLAILGDSGSSIFDTANIERIEVLKGPASVLYGRAEPGGIINLITKQPLDRPRYVAEQQIGSFDHYRTQWDLSSPVTQVPGLAYRFSGAYQNNGSFRAFQGGERLLIAPVVSYRPSNWTEFTLDTQYFSQHAQMDMGIPTIGSKPAPVPLSRSFQEPNNPRGRFENLAISYNFRQNLNEDWKVTNRFLYLGTPSNFSFGNIVPLCSFPFCVGSDMRTLQRLGLYQSSTDRTISTNIDIEGKFAAVGGKHDFLMGLDYLNTYYDYYFGNTAAMYPIDIYNPIYGTVPPFGYWDARIGSDFKFHSSVLSRQKGFYVQDHVTWFDRLHLLVGARYDVADVTNGTTFSFGGDYSATKDGAIAKRLSARTHIDTAWSPRVGAVFDIAPGLSAYASYSRSFGLNNGFTASGQPLGPQRGLQWEAGLKAEPLPGLSATLAVFQITKSGVPTRDFSSPVAVKLAGLQRSRGIELDVIGRVTDRLSIVANYAHIDAKVISDDLKDPLNPFGSGLLYNHLGNVPRHSGKIFVTYDFGESGIGWRVGGGVTASTRAWGDIQNTFLIPGWARLDGFASYSTLLEGHKLTAQLNLRNINNAQYFVGVDNFLAAFGPPLRSIPAAPFTATGTVRVEF